MKNERIHRSILGLVYRFGNVRAKLAVARAAARADKRFRPNIDARLGRAWFAAEDFSRFAGELLDE